jgi:glycerol-3-phosphate dehydrogenase subunit B
VLRYREEARISDGDLAARHDDETRASWLGERIAEGVLRASGEGSPIGAVLVGSWLGAAAPRARAVAARAGIAVGEILIGVGGAAGLRFEAARQAFLSAAGVEVISDRATAVTPADSAVTIALERDDAPLVADAVVLALGGIAGGGIVYCPPEHRAGNDLPPAGAVPFSLSLAAKIHFSVDDTPIDIVSSLHGPAIDCTAWPSPEHPGVIESVGVRCEGVRAAEGIVAAGDIVAGRPRTLLAAVESGIQAGRQA